VRDNNLCNYCLKLFDLVNVLYFGNRILYEHLRYDNDQQLLINTTANTTITTTTTTNYYDDYYYYYYY